MIKKIIRIQGLGLLQNACEAGAVDLGRVTAVYADNGRGKSTFAAMMRACQLRDTGRLKARKTLDSAGEPQVDLLLSTGAHVEFKTDAWTGSAPTIAVFDSEFVEQNVYSGFEIRADQRQSLLAFALGDETVQLKQRVDLLSQSIKDQTTKRSSAEKVLVGLASPYTVQDFVALQTIPDAQEQIDALRKRIEAARSEKQLTARQSPAGLALIVLDVQVPFDLLGKTLEEVEQGAEAEVQAHLAKHAHEDIESWVSNGQAYLSGEGCPFCGQALEGLSLIKAYRSYFNSGYEALKAEVAQVEDETASALADSKVDEFAAVLAMNVARIGAWTDQLPLESPTLDTMQLRTALGEVRTTFLDLFATKSQQPLISVGSLQQTADVEEGLSAINEAIKVYNDRIEEITARLAQFKLKLAAEKIAELEASIRTLEATQRRQRPESEAAVTEFRGAEAERSRLEVEKTQARAQIDALMQKTLDRYQGTINQLLGAFGAEFSIEKLKTSYLGSPGEPRTEFGLRLRNQAVKLGARSDLTTGHSFASTLSEADKRTLAFAFFVARLRTDPKLAETVVVLDDPVASLDRNRRHESKRLIAQMATECKQLIVLSHDAYFVRDFRDQLSKLRPNSFPLTMLTVKRVQSGYSVFAPCDFDELCSSDYFRHHRLVADFVDGKSTADIRDVAKAIRPLLEGYYHRRFPGVIPRRYMFGQIIGLAADPATSEPLAYLRPLTQELFEVNEYASQFHHDTNQSADTATVAEPELQTFARRALVLIYQNG